MQNFILEQNIADISGTNALPLLIDVLPGKNSNGISFGTKVGDMYYLCNRKKTNKNGTLALRCKEYRARDSSCCWSGKIQNISEFAPDSPEYLQRENWVLIPHTSGQVHTCQGSSISEISKLQMMNFVKSKITEGLTDLKSIQQLSGIKRKFEDYGSEMLGDVDIYQRIIQKRRKIDNGGAVPEEFTTINRFDLNSHSLITEQFMHTKSFTYFFLPEFIPLLNDVISADGTFSCVKNLAGITQIYIISTQCYNTERTKTHLQPILMVFLPDKKTVTYTKMWTEIKQFFFEITGQYLSPQRLHIDNESAVINSVQTLFPNTVIVTCLFHLKNNFFKKLGQIGLKNHSKELNALFTTINGIFF